MGDARSLAELLEREDLVLQCSDGEVKVIKCASTGMASCQVFMAQP
jgi:hypothetical protein